jgi:MFS family permease
LHRASLSPLWLLYLATLLLTTPEGGMNIILPPYLDRAQYGVELIGIVTALFALLQLASRLPAGALYSGARARPLLVGFSLLYILSTSTFGLSVNPIAIFPLTILHGFAFGAITTIMLPVAIQLRSRTDSYGARMGWYTAALSAGYALGAFLSGWFADHFGYSWTLIGMGLLPLGTIGLTLLLPAIDSPKLPPPTRRQDTKRGGIRGFWDTMPSLSPALLFATLVAFYINFLDDGFGTFFPLFGLGVGLSLTTIGNLKGIKSATGIVVRAFSGSFFKFIDYRLLNHILVIGWSVVVFALPWVQDQWLFFALFVFMGLARSLSRVTSATIVAEERARDHAGIGVASGIYNMGLDAGSLFGPLVAGFVARLTDIPTMMRIIPMMMVAIYFGAFLWMRRASLASAFVAEAEGD